MFSRPYPSAVSGELVSFNFNWTSSELSVISKPAGEDAEIVVSVTEEDEWGWDGIWHVASVTNELGEKIGVTRLDKEEDLNTPSNGVRWWTEKGWVEGSKFVKVRLGKDWTGQAEVVVSMKDRANAEAIKAWDDQHQEWNHTTWGWGQPRM